MNGASSFFEGTEKKVELMFDPAGPSLRELGRPFWDEVVRRSRAQVLSVISSDACDAYLLSESSLFVLDDQMVMITCGKTTLPPAVLYLLERVPTEHVRFLAYERKNEVYPHRQPTSFFEDASLLRKVLPGRALQFGDEDEHHLYLYQYDRDFKADPRDQTVQLLMVDIDRELRPAFAPGASSPLARLELASLWPEFDWDEHLFEPRGYSLNGIAEDQYLTIHVTPDELGSYASLETNYRFVDGIEPRLNALLERFRPRAFDLITWTTDRPARVAAKGYRLQTHVSESLPCGYHVHFRSHFRPQRRDRRATRLPLPGDPIP